MYYDLDEFLRLSADLNMQLDARNVGRDNTIALLLGRAALSKRDMGVLREVLGYLDAAYGRSRRRLGPYSVLHPLRATWLLGRAQPKLRLLDLLTELLHDKDEDLTADAIGAERHAELEDSFRALLKRIDPTDEWYLMERVAWLTRQPNETYFQYLDKLLDRAAQTPELAAIKLADRLDNTLDLRVDIRDPMQGQDFFRTVFEIMFVSGFTGYRPPTDHPPPSPVNGACRLYQLGKNSVLLSMIRQRDLGSIDHTSRSLVTALALASMKEAQRIVLHIFGYHLRDVATQRELLSEALDYVHTDRISRSTFPSAARPMDGVLYSLFEHTDRTARDQVLAELYEDKPRMAGAAMLLLVVFLSFVDDPAYFIRDVGAEGVRPRE